MVETRAADFRRPSRAPALDAYRVSGASEAIKSTSVPPVRRLRWGHPDRSDGGEYRLRSEDRLVAGDRRAMARD